MEEWGKDLADSMPKFRFVAERSDVKGLAQLVDTKHGEVLTYGSSRDIMRMAGALNSFSTDGHFEHYLRDQGFSDVIFAE